MKVLVSLAIRMFLAAYLMCFKPVLALPNLVARQSSCESIVCPGDWGGFDGFFNHLLDQTPQSPPQPLPPAPPLPQDDRIVNPQPAEENGQDLQTSPFLDKIPQQDPQKIQIPNSPPSTEPQIENFEQVSPWPGDQCEATTSPNPENSGNAGTNTDPCEERKSYIIWPMSCEETSQNAITANMLSGMDSQFLTSIHPLCAVEGGTGFFVARLTGRQTEALEQQEAGVKAVELNPTSTLSKAGNLIPIEEQVPASVGFKRGFIEERAQVSVIRQENADESLSFLSAAPAKIATNRYSYFAYAGQGIRIYIVNGGLDPTTKELAGRPIYLLYAMDVKREPTDGQGPNYGQEATCGVTKVAGSTYGVVKNSDLIIAKTGHEGASFADSIGNIIRDIRSSPGSTKGRCVIHLTQGFEEQECGLEFIAHLHMSLNSLVNVYQCVVVTSSGMERDNTKAAVITTVPARWSKLYDIITVGAVYARDPTQRQAGPYSNGQRFPWSCWGPEIVVAGPGNGLCASAQSPKIRVEGDIIASATVAGLVAYFLSLPDLGLWIRSQPNTPQTMIKFLQLMSYTRFPGQSSVWNGLNAHSSRQRFSFWYGRLNVDEQGIGFPNEP